MRRNNDDSHDCPIRRGAGSLVNGAWCSEVLGPVLVEMPTIASPADVLDPRLLLFEEGPITVRFCPFDRFNMEASVIVAGITPGLHQMYLSCQAAQRCLRQDDDLENALLEAANVAGFAGPMRTNMVSMLDGIGLHDRLGVETVDDLFGKRADLLHGTSALIHPVFLQGKNYGGSPEPWRFAILRAFIDQVFAAELEAIPDALVIPLGRCVEGVLERLVDEGHLDRGRFLFGFPHPSGGNGHRAGMYRENRESLSRQVAAWSCPSHAEKAP